MLENRYDILKKTKESAASAASVVDALTDSFIGELFSERDKNLLSLAFKPSISQADLDVFLTKWDIEAEGGNKALVLAYLMRMHPELKFSDKVAPRLRGLLDYFKFKNIKLISHFFKICSQLKKKKIDALVIKGGAMRHLRPEYPRIMGDIDVVVREKDYNKAVKTAEDMGYNCFRSLHSVDLHLKGSNEGILDIHQFINMNTGKERNINKNLFQRARQEKVFGVEAYVPCMEDMLFIALVNMSRNITEKTSIAGLLYTLFDIQFFLHSKPDFKWEIVIENAHLTKTELQIAFITKLINKLLPGFLPEKIEGVDSFEKQLNDYCILLMYKRFFLWGMKQRGHQLRFWTMFNSWDRFVEYVKLKPKYLVLKSLRFSPKIAQFIMNLDERHHIVERKYYADQFYK